MTTDRNLYFWKQQGMRLRWRGSVKRGTCSQGIHRRGSWASVDVLHQAAKNRDMIATTDVGHQAAKKKGQKHGVVLLSGALRPHVGGNVTGKTDHFTFYNWNITQAQTVLS